MMAAIRTLSKWRARQALWTDDTDEVTVSVVEMDELLEALASTIAESRSARATIQELRLALRDGMQKR